MADPELAEQYIRAELSQALTPLQIQMQIPIEQEQNSAVDPTLSPAPQQNQSSDELTASQSDSATAPQKMQKRPRQPRGKVCSRAECMEYGVRFKGNNSSAWDGKKISVDAEWIEDIYDKSELCPGRILELPYPGKDGKTIYWRVLIVSIPISGTSNVSI